MTQPTNKQEALDQIDSLRAYIEDYDKPKRVRVYIKENAQRFDAALPDHPDTMLAMAGKVYDLKDAEDRVGVWGDDERSDYWYFSHDSCIVVEGELPPNDSKEA